MALQAETQVERRADEAAVWLRGERAVVGAVEAVALERWAQVFGERVVEEVLAYAETGVERPLVDEVFRRAVAELISSTQSGALPSSQSLSIGRSPLGTPRTTRVSGETEARGLPSS